MFGTASPIGFARGEAKKIAFHSYVPHFPLSVMHEAASEAVLPNSLLASTRKLLMKLFLKNSSTGETKPCQTGS
jgi:hypothetical protein